MCSPVYLLVTNSSLCREKKGFVLGNIPAPMFRFIAGGVVGCRVLRLWPTCLRTESSLLTAPQFSFPGFTSSSLSCCFCWCWKTKQDDCCCRKPQLLYVPGNHCISTGLILCNLCIMLSFSFFHFPITNPYRVGI